MVEPVDRVPGTCARIHGTMQVPPINLFLTGISLLCIVHPLHSDPQPPYWMNYETYNPVDRQLYPLHRVPELPRYQSSIGHEAPVTYQRPPSLELNYRSLPNTERVPETDHLPYNYFGPNLEKQEDSKEVEESDSREEEILEKFKILDKLLSEDSNEKDLDTNAIGEKIIPEESKRVVREVQKHKPGFFWTLARVTFETINDTSSAIKQITEIINNNIAPDSATQASMTSALTAINSTNTTGNATSSSITTTPRPSMNFTLTRGSLQRLIRRNVLGLVRLFNIEWKDALNQSEVNVKEFQKDLGKQVGMYLQDNPNAY